MNESTEVQSAADDLESRRPGWVAMAAILMILSATLSAAKCISTYGASFLSIVMVAYSAGFVAVGVGVMTLKKWAYWGFLCLTALGAISIASDLVLMALDAGPYAAPVRNAAVARNLGVIKSVLQLAMGIAWFVYFNMKSVRDAFRVS